MVPLEADFPAEALARAVGGAFVGKPASPILLRRSTFSVSSPFILSPQSLRFLIGQSENCDLISQRLMHGRFLVLDTETTGLAGGTGTLIFLAGIARLDPTDSSLQVFQYFLPDPASEPAFLDCVANHFADDTVLITYNGRAFDVPLLQNRFRLHRRDDLRVSAHLDLLIASRRLLRFYIPDRSLPSLEATLLQKPRVNDIPGEQIPREYQMFLRFGEIGQLPLVFEHNLRDLLSLLDLLRLLGELVSPYGASKDPGIALARGLFEKRAGEHHSAYISLLDAFSRICTMAKENHLGMEQDHIGRLCRELGLIARRLGDWDTALRAWRFWADHFHDPEPCVEIAKYYEHEARDYRQALIWASRAQSFSFDDRKLTEIGRRLNRLQRRLSSATRHGYRPKTLITGGRGDTGTSSPRARRRSPLDRRR